MDNGYRDNDHRQPAASAWSDSAPKRSRYAGIPTPPRPAAPAPQPRPQAPAPAPSDFQPSAPIPATRPGTAGRQTTPRQHVEGYDRSSYGRGIPHRNNATDQHPGGQGSEQQAASGNAGRGQMREQVRDPRIREPYNRDPHALEAQRIRNRQAAGSQQRTARPADPTAHGSEPSNRPAAQTNTARRRGERSYTPMSTADSYRNADRYAKRDRTPSFNFKIPVILAAIAIIAGVGIFTWVQSLPVTVTVNGTKMEVGGEKTATYIYNQGAVQVKPGNLIDVEGQVLQEGKGNLFTLTVNDQTGADPDKRLSNGDVLEFTDGDDVEEASTVNESQVLPFETVEAGTGPIHAVIQEGADGESTTKTGSISGKTVTQVTKPAQNKVYRRYFPDTQGEKVIALTFDDGPVAAQTNELLDVLKENGAKATFFTIGQQIEGENIDVVKRAAKEGHQICTHTFDHAAGSGQGVNLSFMSPQEQLDEVTKGMQAIASATGADASTVIRAPGGNFPLAVWQNVESAVTAEIGWNIDTEDWRQPGTDAIIEAVESAQPGSIILMHDGGGDRSQTIAACREALPHLASKGYKFITIDEMMKYPVANDGAM